MTFKPPADSDRCRAVVLVAFQRGRCRNKRQYGKDLCWKCWTREDDGETVPRVQEAAR